MKTPFDCALSGVELSSLDGSICVLDVIENAPEMHISTSSAHTDGQHILRRARKSLTVQVRFAIHEPNIARRRSVLRTVLAWADQGGLLTTSDRPGQRLRVICTQLPAMAADNMLAEMTLAFTSTCVPWWEDESTVSVSGDAIMSLSVPGTADVAPVDVVAINTGADTITRLTLHCGMTEMVFNGIELAPGSFFSLIHQNGAALAWVDGESVLPCRTAQSADMLLAPCGADTTVYTSSDSALQANFSARGRYV